MGEVVELVKHLRDDGKLQPLIRQLEEIAYRVQARHSLPRIYVLYR